MEEEPVSKITFEQIADFKFTAAYEAYSKAWDEEHRSEGRRRLNDLISRLFNKEISYPRFYGELSQFLGGPGRGREFRRVRIQGQRKRDYKRQEQKRARLKRHKR